MENIIKRDNLQLLAHVVNYLENQEITYSYLEETLRLLMRVEGIENLIEYRIKEKGNKAAAFIPQYASLTISVNKLQEWVSICMRDFKEFLNENDYKKLRGYFLLFVLTHELEHSKQYLMGKKLIESPNEILSKFYKNLMNIFIPNRGLFMNPIKEFRDFIASFKYKQKENFYVLERNANVECLNIIKNVAKFSEDEQISNLFETMRNDFLILGYHEDTSGVIENTYRELLIYDRYKRIYSCLKMSEEDRIRYGFNIQEASREKLLKLKRLKLK